MADKRKSFRARRLAFGRRILPCLCVVASLALAAGAVHAQEAGLKSGAASLAAGKYQDAVRQLSAAINANNVSAGSAAKALYLRGIAYRKMGEPARAVADLGAAIWLGLPQSDRVKALVNRGLAFKAAGLSKQGEAEIASARKIGGSREVDQIIADGGGAPQSAAAIAAFSTEVSREGQASASTSPRSGGFPSFGGGGGSDTAAQPTRTATTSPQRSTATSKPGAAPGAWTTSVAGAEQQSLPAGSALEPALRPPSRRRRRLLPRPQPRHLRRASLVPHLPPRPRAQAGLRPPRARKRPAAKTRGAGAFSAEARKRNRPRHSRRPAATGSNLRTAARRQRQGHCGKRRREPKVSRA